MIEMRGPGTHIVFTETDGTVRIQFDQFDGKAAVVHMTAAQAAALARNLAVAARVGQALKEEG